MGDESRISGGRWGAKIRDNSKPCADESEPFGFMSLGVKYWKGGSLGMDIEAVADTARNDEQEFCSILS